MTQVVAVATGKGGVGKSSVTSAIAGAYAADGLKVAVIELDAQGDIADDFGVRDHPDQDEGTAVASSVKSGTPLGAGILARPNLTYFAGGEALEELARTPGWTGLDSKLRAAIDQLDGYDIVLIDTPPSAEALQQVSLAAAQYLLIPTAVDNSSLRALYAISYRMVDVEQVNPDIAFLGVVLWNVPTAASRIRSEARATLNEILGDVVPLLDTTIRSAFATAYECRRRGMLPQEMADTQSGAQSFWKALKAGIIPDRTPTSAQSLAGDYHQLAAEILERLKVSR
jgi:chromosome partitioning protein